MDADYLKENVGSILALGLTDVVLVNPEDPVSYLAQWLHNHVDQLDAEAAAKESIAAKLEADTQYAAVAAAAQAAQSESTAAAAAQKAANDRVVLQALEDATSTEGLLQTLCASIVDTHNVQAAYIYQLQNKETMRIVASNQTELLGRELIRAGDEEEPEGKGVTFTLFDELDEDGDDMDDEDKEEEDDEESEKESKNKTKKEERFMYIADVLSDPKAANVQFYNLPQSGSLFVVRVRYESCLNVDTITQGIREEENIGDDSGRKKNDTDTESETEETEDESTEPESEAKGDDETSVEDSAAAKESDKAAQAEALEERLLGAVSLKKEDLVLAVDTLGQYKRLTNDQQALFKQYAATLGQTIERIDHGLFREERKRRVNLQVFNQKQTDAEKDEAELKTDFETIQQTLTDEEKPATNDDVNFQMKKDALLSTANRKFLLNELGKFEVFWGPIGVVQALLLLLGYEAKDLTEDGQGDFVSWTKIRKLFTEEFIAKIENLDPRSEDVKLGNKKALAKLIKGQSVSDLKEQNYVLSDMLAFIVDAQQLKSTADEERKRIKAEAEAELKRAQEAAGIEAKAAEESAATEESEVTESTTAGETTATETETETETETDYTETETETETE